ncbi:MAG: hypothetical protein HOJ55_05315 [Euryarchaeota archaeon]|jgi:hypothetical protein|nr:hypothetical protein [Euryarchaeota archaeon]MBT5593250.1 hypothetical protein [Euryarchaeota archaeon]
MDKSIVIELPSETRWVVFARWIIAPGLVLWASLYITGWWMEDDEMMQFNCFNLMAFLGFAIALMLVLINPMRTVVVSDNE